MSKVDLHVHTTVSDGRFSPEEIVRKAVEQGVEYIAITDHDTIDGIIPALEAAGAFPPLKVIPGIEMSCDAQDGEVHVLGYFIDYANPFFQYILERLHNARRERARKMVDRLGELGVNIEWERVTELAGSGSLGRPHIAQAMLERGYIATFRDAFTEYIGRGKPAYIEYGKMTPEQAVQFIQQNKGLPVLAHPLTVSDMETTITNLKELGLVGIEAYYDAYTEDQTQTLVNLADKHNLIATGGSDYHGIDFSAETMLGGVEVPLESVIKLITLAEQRGLKV